MKKKNLLLIALITALFTANAWAREYTIAVMDFESEDIPENQIELIEDYIANQVLQTGIFKVIDRNQREILMREIEFSASGFTDETIQIEAGKFLAADGIITGTIGKVGNTYLLNLKLIRTESGETINSASKAVNSLEALINSVENITKTLLGLEAGPDSSTSTTSTRPSNTPSPSRSGTESAIDSDTVSRVSISMITGKWKGDKGLVHAYIYDDGTGEAYTGYANMKLKIIIRGSKITVEQNEPNYPGLYQSFVPYSIASQLAEVARPMSWEFNLSTNEQVLTGIKKTTWFRVENGQVKEVDNSWSREAVWIKESEY